MSTEVSTFAERLRLANSDHEHAGECDCIGDAKRDFVAFREREGLLQKTLGDVGILRMEVGGDTVREEGVGAHSALERFPSSSTLEDVSSES